jgi:ABC-2 type transport system ATP-binding protein
MARRLNLACAMVHDPRVLLLDEPTVGVDPQSRNAIFDSIEKLIADGRTIIYTTHYMEEAQRLCDRVAIIDHGKILDVDTVPSLIEKHGGKSVIEAELTKPPDDHSRLPGEIEGTTLRIETEKPLEMVAELGRSGFEFTRMNIVKADLETVFLNLTGRRLRD